MRRFAPRMLHASGWVPRPHGGRLERRRGSAKAYVKRGRVAIRSAACARWSSNRPGGELRERELPDPEPGPGQLLLRVLACGVCRTDLHMLDGELPGPRYRVVLGPPDRRRVIAGAGDARSGERVGVPWLGWTYGDVPLLHARAARTSATVPASPAATSTAATPSWRSPTSASAFRSRTATTTLHAAPLLCAGLIGYRALRDGGRRASASASTASARPPTSSPRSPCHQGRRVFAFTRAGRRGARRRSRASSAPSGRATRDERRRSRSTRRSSSRRSARWCRPRCAPARKGGAWCAPAST